MKTSNKSQGFAVLEAALIIVVIGIIGFTGWYVWHARQDTNKTLASNPSPADQVGIKAAPTVDKKKAEWYLFTSEKGGYSMRLPDGWNFIQDTSVGSIYNDRSDSTSTTDQEGTAATVKDVAEGTDYFGNLTFRATMLSSRSLADSDVAESSKQLASFKTDDGADVTVYYYKDEAAHTKQWVYRLKNGTSALEVTYIQFKGADDQSSTVAKVVKTASVNN